MDGCLWRLSLAAELSGEARVRRAEIEKYTQNETNTAPPLFLLAAGVPV
jgi:hypothetical protein